jgi:hypothetical protein
MDGACAHLPADRPAAFAHTTMCALRVVITLELALHTHCVSCGRRLGQSTRTMSDHARPGGTL